jgi:hypothetical protein
MLNYTLFTSLMQCLACLLMTGAVVIWLFKSWN